MEADSLVVIEGNIVDLQVDAIVNAANSSLLGGGGVDGAIHRAAGPQLLVECRELGGCHLGEAKITQGYNLSANWVIHTVGPIWKGGNKNEDEILARCYRSCFAIAEIYEISSLAFPAISTGAYGFPMERAAKIAVREVQDLLVQSSYVERAFLVAFDRAAYDGYVAAIKEIFSN